MNIRFMQYAFFTFMLVMMSNVGLYASDLSLKLNTKAINLDESSNFVNEDQEKVVSNVKVFYNPIAQQISVSLKVNKESNIIVKVMDALGNEVLNLMNGTLEVGNQNLNFETNDKLTTGFYFVRISIGTEAVVKRISVR